MESCRSNVYLFSLPNLRKSDKLGTSQKDIDFIIKESFCPSTICCELGPADIKFASPHASFVELLMVLPCVLDIFRFTAALFVTLEESFPICGGFRKETGVSAGDGISFSCMNVKSEGFKKRRGCP